FFAEETVDRIKRAILEARRARRTRWDARRGRPELDKHAAREAWDELTDALEYGGLDAFTEDCNWFVHVLTDECPRLFEDVFGGDYHAIPIVAGLQPQLAAFMERVWPHFMDILQAEREAAKVAAAPSPAGQT